MSTETNACFADPKCNRPKSFFKKNMKCYNMRMKQVIVAIVGRPSSGKSTFVNTITENKVSIVSSVPQSTLSMVKGIYENSDKRFVFLDTPGLYDSNVEFNKLLRKQSLNAIRECDCLLYMIDGKDKIKAEEEKAAFYVRTSGKPAVVLINKSDLLGDGDEKRVRSFLTSALKDCNQIHVGSAKNDEGLDDVLRALAEYAKEIESPNQNQNREDENPLPEFTESPVEFRISETIREAAFGNLMEEIPHAICVICDDMSEREGTVTIKATIYCERESQKGIIIGKAGSMIKKIKNSSIKGLKSIFPGRYVEIELTVKVKKDWKRDKRILTKLGLIS